MGDHSRPFGEFLDAPDGFFFAYALFLDHLVGDLGLGDDLRRNGDSGIDEEIDALGHDTIFDKDGAELGNAIEFGR